MKRSRPLEKTLILLLVKRLDILLFSLCLLTLFLYVIGTRQEFMDVTQLFLLRILGVLGVSLTAGSLSGCALNLQAAFLRRGRGFIPGAGGYLLLGVFGAAAAFFAALIMTAVEGNIR